MSPLKQAFLRIFIVTLVVSGIPWIAFISYSYLILSRENDPKYEIVAIVETTLNQESLKNAFLAELLDLSVDQPTNLYSFSLSNAKKKLLNFPCIKEASVKRIPPGIVSIDYTLRKPVALLGDYTNTAIDKEFYPFPFSPFYSPKKLPIIRLGLDQVKWGEKIINPKLKLAFQVLESLEKEEPFQIDVSLVDATSLGDQKIIVQFIGHDVLLDPLSIHDGLVRYKKWRKMSHEDKELMIDLRLPHLGFITKDLQ